MDLGLEGKLALVTGGSRGIGRATSIALAREGAKVIFSYASNQAAAEETVAAIEAAGGSAQAIQFDVKDPEAGKAALTGIQKEHGPLAILVNNAGVARDNLLVRTKDAELQQSFETNVYGPFYLARAAARGMMKARYGRIIMMGSVVGHMGNQGQAVYGATKAALAGMTRSLARELASRAITVNLVAPGFIDTDMTKQTVSEAMREQLEAAIPLNSLGKGEDIADAVCFLCSDRARYITGQVLHVNGGMFMS